MLIFVNFDCDTGLQEANIFERLILSILQQEDGTYYVSRIMVSLNNWSRSHVFTKKSYFEEQKTLRVKYSKTIEDFNSSGDVQLLIDSGLVSNFPKSVAQFLYSRRSILNLAMVGMILGSQKDIHSKILSEYVSLVDVHNLNICPALYHFLTLFQLPPESQQIDRVLIQFASHYYLSNPTVLKDADQVYGLLYALLMLHTSVWNPHVKEKMSKQMLLTIIEV